MRRRAGLDRLRRVRPLGGTDRRGRTGGARRPRGVPSARPVVVLAQLDQVEAEGGTVPHRVQVLPGHPLGRHVRLCGLGRTTLHRVEQHPAGLVGLRPVLRVLAQQRHDDGGQRPGLLRVRRLLGHHGLHGADRRGAAERGGALHRRVEGGPERPEVGGRAGVAAPHPLGRQIVDGADEFTGSGDRRVPLDRRDPEVGDQDPPVARQQDVARLDVPVQHPGRVRGAQRAEDVQPDPGRLVGVDRTLLLGGVGERGPVDVLHHDPRPVVVLQNVVDGHHTRVGDPRGGPRLLLRTGVEHEPVGLRHEAARRQLLHRHDAVQHLVVRPPDLAHAAAPDGLAQPVATGEQKPRPCALRMFHLPPPVPSDARLRRGYGRRNLGAVIGTAL